MKFKRKMTEWDVHDKVAIDGISNKMGLERYIKLYKNSHIQYMQIPLN